MLNLKPYVEEVKRKKPLWKSQSRIMGQAAEDWCEDNFKCYQCGDRFRQYPNNEAGKDLYCPTCGLDVQVKAGKSRKKGGKNGEYRINGNGVLKIIGADYKQTLSKVKVENIDYMFVGYCCETYDITFLKGITHSEMNESFIVRRNRLSQTARRAGWVGCYLVIPEEKLHLLTFS